MRVLVVDDDCGIRKLISVMLDMLGHEPILAENGLEAVRRFASDGRRFDLVITDLNMPVMNGYETIREIRRISPNARIVLMSANCGADRPPDTPFLEKPFNLMNLDLCLHLASGCGEQLRKAG
jgi:CheY-like chemotaxis protein